jgi:hypothetical protein
VNRKKATLIAIALAATMLGAAAGSSNESADTTTTTTTSTPAETTTTVDPAAAAAAQAAETVRFDKEVQQDLNDVGCYAGSVDGKFGPRTDAAILAFQAADGIKADGQYGINYHHCPNDNHNCRIRWSRTLYSCSTLDCSAC